jgi:hypothetical protein
MPGALFPDLAEFLDDSFTLPYRGKSYRVPPPDATTGIYLQSIMDAGESLLIVQSIKKADQQILSDDQERTAFQMALGSVYDEMIADKVPWPVLKVAGMTAMLYWTRGSDLALRYWSSQGKAPEPDPETPTEESPTSSDSSPTGP